VEKKVSFPVVMLFVVNAVILGGAIGFCLGHGKKGAQARWKKEELSNA